MLLSTVVMHHHHMEQICLAVQQCHVDGALNDEHTSHQENEQEGCTVHQMRQFIVNAKVVKTIRQHLLGPSQTLALAACMLSVPQAETKLLPATVFPDADKRLLARSASPKKRRGPPMFS